MNAGREINFRRALYALCDFLSVAVGWFVFNILRYFTIPAALLFGSLGNFLQSRQVLFGQFLIPLMMTAIYAVSGAYNRSGAFIKSRLDEVLNAALVSLLGMLGVFFTVLIDDNIPERMTNYELMVTLWLCIFLPTATVRLWVVTVMSRRARNGSNGMRTLVTGLSKYNAGQLERIKSSCLKAGLSIIGCTDVAEGTPEKCLGGLRRFDSGDLRTLCRRLDVQAILVLPDKRDFAATVTLLNELYSLEIPVFVTHDLFSMLAARPRVSSVIGEPLVDITAANLSPWAANTKRLGDILVSSIALIALLPVYAVLALAVKLDSPGPAIYRQRRIGYRKKPFTIYKFRTMRSDAESAGPELASKDDPRVTRTGHILRKYRLDELPQFWNVLKGDMSLVGPRPEREFYLRQLVERHPAITLLHQVRPGITSWGMVKYGYAADVDQMLERLPYDMLYIENVSLGVDLKILFHTVNTVLRGRGQ